MVSLVAVVVVVSSVRSCASPIWASGSEAELLRSDFFSSEWVVEFERVWVLGE